MDYLQTGLAIVGAVALLGWLFNALTKNTFGP